jgi:Bacterial PH domain
MKASHEHEFEAQLGLPEKLPQGETILWQGTPDWISLAIEAFHLRALVIYFTLMLLFQINYLTEQPGALNLSAIALSVFMVVMLLSSITLWAWMTAKASVYTLTNKRVVMRVGLVLSVTFNLPLRKILAANELHRKNSSSDISLSISEKDRIAWIHLWPHARPWRLNQPEPTLRCIKEGHIVAQTLKSAWLLEQQNTEPMTSLPHPILRATPSEKEGIPPFRHDAQSGLMKGVI